MITIFVKRRKRGLRAPYFMITKGQEDLTKKNLSKILEDLTWDLYKNKDLKKDIRDKAKNLIDAININFEHPFETQVAKFCKGETNAINTPSNQLVVCRIPENVIKSLNNVFLKEPDGCVRTPLYYNYNQSGRSPKYVCYYENSIVHVLCFHKSWHWRNAEKYRKELWKNRIPYIEDIDHNFFIVEIGTTSIENVSSFCKNIDFSKEPYYDLFKKFTGKYFKLE